MAKKFFYQYTCKTCGKVFAVKNSGQKMSPEMYRECPKCEDEAYKNPNYIATEDYDDE